MMGFLAGARNGLLALHLVAAALWVGGLYLAAIGLRGPLAQLEAAKRVQFEMQVYARFFRLVWHLAPVMFVTGWLMVFGAWGGFATLPVSIHAMQGFAVLMLAVFAYAYFVPWQKLRRAIRPSAEHLAGVRRLVLVDLALGVAAIVAGALGHSW